MPSLEAINAIRFENPLEKFKAVLEGIGGVLIYTDDLQQVTDYVKTNFKEAINTSPALKRLPE